jgi:hypothetical protein
MFHMENNVSKVLQNYIILLKDVRKECLEIKILD